MIDLQQTRDAGRQAALVELVAQPLQDLDLRWIAVDRACQLGERNARGHQQRDFADHLSGVPGDDRAADDLRRAAAAVEDGESLVVAVQDCPIDRAAALRGSCRFQGPAPWPLRA